MGWCQAVRGDEGGSIPPTRLRGAKNTEMGPMKNSTRERRGEDRLGYLQMAMA